MSTVLEKCYDVNDLFEFLRWGKDAHDVSEEFSRNVADKDTHQYRILAKMAALIALFTSGNDNYKRALISATKSNFSAGKFLKINSKLQINWRVEEMKLDNLCVLALRGARSCLLMYQAIKPEKDMRKWALVFNVVTLVFYCRNIPSSLIKRWRAVPHKQEPKRIQGDAQRLEKYASLKATLKTYQALMDSPIIPEVLWDDEIISQHKCFLDPKHPPVREPVCFKYQDKVYIVERIRWNEIPEDQLIPGLECRKRDGRLDVLQMETLKISIDKRLTHIAREAGLTGGPQVVAPSSRAWNAVKSICGSIPLVRVLSVDWDELLQTLFLGMGKLRRMREDIGRLLPGPAPHNDHHINANP